MIWLGYAFVLLAVGTVTIGLYAPDLRRDYS